MNTWEVISEMLNIIVEIAAEGNITEEHNGSRYCVFCGAESNADDVIPAEHEDNCISLRCVEILRTRITKSPPGKSLAP